MLALIEIDWPGLVLLVRPSCDFENYPSHWYRQEPVRVFGGRAKRKLGIIKKQEPARTGSASSRGDEVRARERIRYPGPPNAGGARIAARKSRAELGIVEMKSDILMSTDLWLSFLFLVPTGIQAPNAMQCYAMLC